jgi:hypothetical protein
VTATKTSNDSQKIEQIYRRQLAFEKKLDVLLEQLPKIAGAAAASAVTMKILADHVARLTREKETLVKMCKEANTYMATDERLEPKWGPRSKA